jgi:putative hemolysin
MMSGGTSAMLGVLLVGAMALSFLLSGMEAGVLALSRFKVRRQMRSGLRRAKLLHEYLENPQDFLWTILVGNTLASFTAFGVVVFSLFDLLGQHLWLFALAVFLAVVLFFIFCDLLPKVLFRQFPNRLCLVLAVPFRLLHLMFSPLVRLLTWSSDLLLRWTGAEPFKTTVFHSRREVRIALQEATDLLSSEERAMVNRVLDLQDLTVRSIAVPLSKAIGVSTTTPMSEVLRICREQPVSRLPVWDESGPKRRIVGVVSMSALLYADDLDLAQPVKAYARPPLLLREDMRLEGALRRMQRAHQRIAVLMDSDQREIGIVHLRDILKSIFGEVTL